MNKEQARLGDLVKDTARFQEGLEDLLRENCETHADLFELVDSFRQELQDFIFGLPVKPSGVKLEIDEEPNKDVRILIDALNQNFRCTNKLLREIKTELLFK